MPPFARALLVSLGLLTLLTGVGYPLVSLGLAQALFPEQANGSLIRREGRVVGSALIGQRFEGARYFWGRPSATTPQPYDAASSAGSNLAPSNPSLAAAVAARSARLADTQGMPGAAIPLELVTTSGSGLDPELTVAGMYYQVARVAAARGLEPALVRALVDAHVEDPAFGFLGPRRVNVLAVNLALDAR